MSLQDRGFLSLNDEWYGYRPVCTESAVASSVGEWAITCWTGRSSSSAWQPVFLCDDDEAPTHRQLTARITRWGRWAGCPSRRPLRLTPPHAGVVRRRRPRSLAGAETLTSYTDMDVMRRGRRRSRNVSIINLGLTFMLNGAYVRPQLLGNVNEWRTGQLTTSRITAGRSCLSPQRHSHPPQR